MNQTINTDEYINNLPKAVQDLVFTSAWQERTEDIAKKYSLNEAQTESLVDNVLYILIGLETPENFLENLIKEMDVSNLLAEQIMEDLEVRVFEYALKSVEKKMEKGNSQKTVESAQEKQTDTKNTEREVKTMEQIPLGQAVKEKPQVQKVVEAPKNEIEVRPNDLPAQVGLPVKTEQAKTVPNTKPVFAKPIQPKVEVKEKKPEEKVVVKTEVKQEIKSEIGQETKPIEAPKPVFSKLPPIHHVTTINKEEIEKQKIEEARARTATQTETKTVDDIANPSGERRDETGQSVLPSRIVYKKAEPLASQPQAKPDPSPANSESSAPQAVPRFIAAPLEEDKLVVQNPKTDAAPARNIISDKLSGVSSGVKAEPTTEAVKTKYTVDPYREPIG